MFLCVLVHIWTKGEVGAPWNRFKPSCKIFYWPFKGGASFVDHLCYFCLVFVMLSCSPCGHVRGKDWPRGSHLLCLIVKLSLSHWYPGSGVVLHCIDSWSLPYFLLSNIILGNSSTLFLGALANSCLVDGWFGLTERRLSSMSHACSMGFISGDFAGQSILSTPCSSR